MPSSTVWRHAADRNDRKKRPSEAGDIHLREGGSPPGSERPRASAPPRHTPANEPPASLVAFPRSGRANTSGNIGKFAEVEV